MYEDIYVQNMSRLRAIANRFRAFCERDGALDVEDLVHIGFIGLIHATLKYDINTPSGRKRADWLVIDEIKKAFGKSERINAEAMRMDAPMQEDSDVNFGEMLADNSLPAIDEELLLDELRRSMREAIEDLSDPRQRYLIEHAVLADEGLDAAADSLGVGKMRALRIYGRALANLARDNRVKALVDLDDRTRFHAHKGVRAFLSDNTSVTEAAALWRIEQQTKMGGIGIEQEV